MFRGISALNLDAKGRLAIPTKYREPLKASCDGQLIVTIDTEQPCLLLYPLGEWQTIEAKLANLPSFNPTARRIQRLLIGHATDVELDGNGRLILPATLREYAGLDKKAVLLGQGKKFEIWSEATWQASRDEWLADPLDLADVLPEQLETLSL
jgi:MraZ protein